MNKPVAWMDGGGHLYHFADDADRGQTMRPLYLEQPTHPTKLLGPNLEQILNSAGFYRKREWEGLTELEKAEITSLKWWDWEDTFDIDGFIKTLEAKLKEKNK